MFIRNAVMDLVQRRTLLPERLDAALHAVQRIARLRASGIGVIVRSSLKEGFLTGKFRRDATFPDPRDQRRLWTAQQVADTVAQVEQFRFLEAEAGSLIRAAVAYPLSFGEVSTVILGTKSRAQAEVNFGVIPGARLAAPSLLRIYEMQRELGLFDRRARLRDRLRSLLPAT